MGKGLSAGIIIELMTYFMANMIPMGLPLSMLLAAIMTMGNLGENYELLAMKSAGMSLVKITKPLIILVSIVSVGSFFIGNDLVPSANKKLYSTLYDIRQQKQALEFQDGLFFNGIDNMSIRVSHQDPDTHLLHNVLIYDNRAANNNMNTILADSGYIRLSDDKRFLLVTLFHGETYEQTRNSQWFTKERAAPPHLRPAEAGHSDGGLRHGAHRRRPVQQQQHQGHRRPVARHRLARGEGQCRDDHLLRTAAQRADLRARQLRAAAARQPARGQKRLPRSRGRRFRRPAADAREGQGWNLARTLAKSSRNTFSSFDESTAKGGAQPALPLEGRMAQEALPAGVDPHFFFLIGAPLGAIIRRGGLGLPVVVSVIFFVIYYIISLTGEKLAKEGNWEAVYGVWLSTFILTPIAVYLTWKATNDSALLDTDWYAGRIKALRDRIAPAAARLTDKLKFRIRNRHGKANDAQ